MLRKQGEPLQVEFVKALTTRPAVSSNPDEQGSGQLKEIVPTISAEDMPMTMMQGGNADDRQEETPDVVEVLQAIDEVDLLSQDSKRRKTHHVGSHPVIDTPAQEIPSAVPPPPLPPFSSDQQQRQQPPRQQSKSVGELLDYLAEHFYMSFKDLMAIDEMLEWMESAGKLRSFEKYVHSQQSNTQEVVKDALKHYTENIKGNNQ